MSELLHDQKDVATMIRALEIKGFRTLSHDFWMYRNTKRDKYISVRIDAAGYIIVNFNGNTIRVMSPNEVMGGLNHLKGKSDHPVLFVG